LKIIICTVALETRGAKKKNALVQGILEKNNAPETAPTESASKGIGYT
jgi:hypothetical protein